MAADYFGAGECFPLGSQIRDTVEIALMAWKHRAWQHLWHGSTVHGSASSMAAQKMTALREWQQRA